MPETPEQYIQRITKTLGENDPLQILQATPAKLTTLVSGKSEDLLRKRPAAEKWSVAEIVAHLSEAEIAIAFRLRMILSSSGVAIQAFDQDAWAKRYATMPLSLSLNLFRAVREANLALYRSLTPEEWQQYGMHSERGKESLRQVMTLHGGHDINHLKQIEGIIGVS
jgi:DinB superfamily